MSDGLAGSHITIRLAAFRDGGIHCISVVVILANVLPTGQDHSSNIQFEQRLGNDKHMKCIFI